MLPITLDSFRLFLHLTAATVWVGGQIVFVGLLPVLRRAGAEVPRMVATSYNRIAWTAFGVLFLTGMWNLGEVAAENNGSYSTTLTVKLVAVVLSGVAAFVHTRVTGRTQVAVWGAVAGLSALVALLLGVVLVEG